MFLYDGKYKAALSVYNANRLQWPKPRCCLGCWPLSESFWLKFSKYFHCKAETVEKYSCAQVSYLEMFYYCSVSKEENWVWLQLRMFQYIRAVWNSTGLSMHLQFRAALGEDKSEHNNEGTGWQEREGWYKELFI